MSATRNIFEKYIEADFVGLFSHHEGFPNAICEGMAIKMPVIVSGVSDLPLFIKDNLNGFICDSKSIESIKESLMKAVDSTPEERASMGEKNLKVTNEYFNKEKIINSYLSLLTNEK